jgi:hypothetical protein
MKIVVSSNGFGELKRLSIREAPFGALCLLQSPHFE